MKTLSLFFLVGVIRSHDQFESELDGNLGKQEASPTGAMLGNYGVAFERNLPIYMTTDLMFREIIDTARSIMHPHSIFSDMNNGQMPNWLLMFSIPNCIHCVEIKPAIIDLATFYHDP